MNDTQPKQEIVYANGTWVRSHKFADGGEILKLSIAVDRFTEFLKQYKKQDGFVNLIISAKRIPDEKSSHSIKLDSWVPNSNKSILTKSTPKVEKSKQVISQEPTVDEETPF